MNRSWVFGPTAWTVRSIVVASALYWGGLIVLVLQNNNGTPFPISDALANSTSARIMFGSLGTIMIADRAACFSVFGTAIDHFDADAWPAQDPLRGYTFHVSMVWWLLRLACWVLSVVFAFMVIAVPTTDPTGAHDAVSSAFFGFYEVEVLLGIPQHFVETRILYPAEKHPMRFWRDLESVAEVVFGFGGILTFSILYLAGTPQCVSLQGCRAVFEWMVVAFAILNFWFQRMDLKRPDAELERLAQLSLEKPKLERLADAARASLSKNLVDGLYVAGQNQYRAAWVRDTCFSAHVLVQTPEGVQAVRNLVQRYAAAMRNKHGPKVFDSTAFEWRQVRPVLTRMLCFGARASPETFAPRYATAWFTDSASGREAVDGNALVLIAASELSAVTKDSLRNILADSTGEILQKMVDYYRNRISVGKGLVEQHAFSDWQDSLRREGYMLTTNLLVWRAFNVSGNKDALLVAPALRDAIVQHFFADASLGVLTDRPGPQSRAVALDGNLLALKWGFFHDEVAKRVYRRLKQTTAWHHSVVHWPKDPQSEVYWPLSFIGLKEYHNGARWSWILGLQATVAHKFGDLEEHARITRALCRVTGSEDVHEVYSPHTPVDRLRPWRTLGYVTEAPFTWGAAYVLECCQVAGVGVGGAAIDAEDPRPVVEWTPARTGKNFREAVLAPLRAPLLPRARR